MREDVILLRLLTIFYAFLGAAALLYIVLFSPPLYLAVGVVAVLCVLPIFFIKTEYGLLLLIFIRPLIDIFSGYSVTLFDRLTLNLNAVLAVLVCVWLALVWLRDRIHWSTIIGRWPLLAFLVASGVSAVYSIDFTASLSEWLRLLSLVVFFVVAQHLAQTNKHFIVHIINVAAWSLVIPLLVAGFQLVTGGGLDFGELSNRVYGTLGHPNVFALYLVFILAVMLIKYIATPKPERSLLYPWILAFGSIALLFTYTRAAWIGLGIILAILGLVRYRKAIVLTGALISVVLVFGQMINQFAIDTLNVNLYDIPLVGRFTTRSEEADSINWRLEVLQTMAPRVLERPYFGFGIGNFVALRQEDPDFGLFDDPEAHNDYLRLAIETGFIGLISYLIFLLVLGIQTIKNYLAWPKTAWQKWYSLILGAMLIAFAVMSVSDNLLQGTPVMWMFLSLVGALVTLQRSKIAHRSLLR
jgi:O-antigen ligase